MTRSPSPRAVRILLADWQAAGLTHLFRESTDGTPASERKALASGPSDTGLPMPIAEPTESESEVELKKGRRPQGRAAREAALQQIDACVKGCTRCHELATTRTQTVFGVGNPEARVMFVGEAPGADEDAQGEPFVGRAGQLLNKIIAACGWQRDELYICNILRCRRKPPTAASTSMARSPSSIPITSSAGAPAPRRTCSA
jgi:uracil-DNA glycosylase